MGEPVPTQTADDPIRTAVDKLHEEDALGEHRSGFCKACGDNYAAMNAVAPLVRTQVLQEAADSLDYKRITSKAIDEWEGGFNSAIDVCVDSLRGLADA